MKQFITTFGRKISLIETRNFESLVSEVANSSCNSVFFCNVHMLMLSQEDPVLASAMDDADWVFADGVPVSWLQCRISGKDAKVIRGHEFMQAVCARATREGENVGFIGSTDKVLKCLVNNLCDQFEGLTVAYQFSPPFIEGELSSTPAELQSINDSQVKWLFVGLGCPKQEKWIATYKNELDCNILGVGAAFDWLSGQTSKPPIWMERNALGWLHRLLHNPSKMWHRYIIYNTKFIVKAAGVLLRGK